MKEVELRVTVEVPDEVSYSDVLAWAEFHLGQRGVMVNNPLREYDFEDQVTDVS